MPVDHSAEKPADMALPTVTPGSAGSAFIRSELSATPIQEGEGSGEIPRNFRPAVTAKYMNERAWHSSLNRQRLEPYTTTPLKNSIALLARRAIEGDFSRAELTAQLNEVNLDDASPRATLLDAKGSIQCSFTTEVVKKYRDHLRNGAVALLHDVRAIFLPPRRHRGYHFDISLYLHISIHRSNIGAIWKTDPRIDFTLRPLKIRYTPEAEAPFRITHEMYKAI